MRSAHIQYPYLYPTTIPIHAVGARRAADTAARRWTGRGTERNYIREKEREREGETESRSESARRRQEFSVKHIRARTGRPNGRRFLDIHAHTPSLSHTANKYTYIHRYILVLSLSNTHTRSTNIYNNPCIRSVCRRRAPSPLSTLHLVESIHNKRTTTKRKKRVEYNKRRERRARASSALPTGAGSRIRLCVCAPLSRGERDKDSPSSRGGGAAALL